MIREDDDADLTGREIGGYRVLRRVGAGGMATVYLAEQRSLGRQVALKVLSPTLARDSAYVSRFLNEARAAASLVHANIVQIYEVSEAEGLHYIAQEYVRGKNLGELLKRQTALEPALVLDILRHVLAALAKAAEAGIVHRDIKPENILLGQGEVKVADFGLARIESADAKTLTQVGVTMGTPLYMSPEQIEGRAVDVRSDIYSLGITCYHLLAGAPPHRGDTALAIAVQHLNGVPRPLENVRSDVPSGLARIVHRMIAKKADQRFQSPGELLVELRQLAGEAAAEGWAEAPEEWSLAEWMSTVGARSDAAAELNRLMHEQARLDESRWPRWRTIAIVLLALAAGMTLAIAWRRQPYLVEAPAATVEPRETAWKQLFHANMAPSEEAWLAVRKYFPNEDQYVYDRANEGLVRYHLLLSQRFERALPPLKELADSPDAAASDSPLRAFVYASLCIVHQRTGDEEQAREAASQLTSGMKDELRRSEAPLYQLLQSSLRAISQ